jgi:hypothetical protein
VIGVIGVAVGLGILAGQVWATIAGLAFAVVSTLSQFLLMPTTRSGRCSSSS